MLKDEFDFLPACNKKNIKEKLNRAGSSNLTETWASLLVEASGLCWRSPPSSESVGCCLLAGCVRTSPGCPCWRHMTSAGGQRRWPCPGWSESCPAHCRTSPPSPRRRCPPGPGCSWADFPPGCICPPCCRRSPDLESGRWFASLIGSEDAQCLWPELFWALNLISSIRICFF